MAIDSKYIFKFLSSSWDFMPKNEKNRLANLWKGYEQIFADIYQRFYELDHSLNINSMPVFLSSRWNEYLFNTDNVLEEPAVLDAYQDLSLGLNLVNQYYLKIGIDGETPISIDCRGINPAQTTIFEVQYAINNTLGFEFCSLIFEDTVLSFTTRTKGADSSIEIFKHDDELLDATEIILGITDIELPHKVPLFNYKYILPANNIQGMPSLQDTIRPDKLTAFYIEAKDFKIDRERAVIGFREPPREVLWAQVTYLNEEVPYYNFGDLINYRDTTITQEEYLANLKGLWFAFWMGPRPEFVRRALCLLFGLPVSYDTGIVTRISGPDNNIMEILHIDGVFRAYALPSQLLWEVTVGDYVDKFQPLTDGIDVMDKTNTPGFVETEIGRKAMDIYATDAATKGPGDTDETKAITMLEEHTFLPQINVNAFVRPNINVGSILRFLQNIKPLQKAFYFQIIVALFKEELKFTEQVRLDFAIDITPNLDSNQTTHSGELVRADYEINSIPQLDLDSDTLGFYEAGELEFSDNSGPLPQYDVLFD